MAPFRIKKKKAEPDDTSSSAVESSGPAIADETRNSADATMMQSPAPPPPPPPAPPSAQKPAMDEQAQAAEVKQAPSADAKLPSAIGRGGGGRGGGDNGPRLPDGWSESEAGGALVHGYIAPVKTPLSEAFHAQIEPKERWTPAVCVEACGGAAVAVVIDLTATHRYYLPSDLPPGVAHLKVVTQGRGVPSEEMVHMVLRAFYKASNDGAVRQAAPPTWVSECTHARPTCPMRPTCTAVPLHTPLRHLSPSRSLALWPMVLPACRGMATCMGRSR